MLTVLIVGICIGIFGALVLLRFPNRPGGKISFGRMEVSSVGAGLPLICLGVACIVTYAFNAGTSLDTEPTDGKPAVETEAENGESTTEFETEDEDSEWEKPAADFEDCFLEHFSEIPTGRLWSIEEGALYVYVTEPGQSLTEPIAIQLTENREMIGAIQFSFYLGTGIFKIEAVVDADCQTVEDYANITSGGDKHVLQLSDDLSVTFGGNDYVISLCYEEEDEAIAVIFFREPD